MQKDIFTYELKLLRRDGIASLTLLLFLGAMMYAGWVGFSYTRALQEDQQTQLANYEALVAESYGEAREQERAMIRDSVSLDTYVWGPRNPYAIGSSLGKVIPLNMSPLTAFAIGQSDLHPAALKVSVAGVRSVGPTATLENPFKLLVGHFDLSFVFLFIYPLLIIALTYGLTAAERESGLLRMLLAQPIQLVSLVVGKISVRAAILAGSILLGTSVLWGFAGTEGLYDGWVSWLLVSFAYGVFWLGLCVFVDSRVNAASTSAIVLAGCWLLLAVVAPALISFFASTLYPVPSRMEYITAMRTESSLAQQQGAASLAQFFEDHPEIAPVNDDEANFAMLRIAREEQIAEQLAPLEGRYNEQRSKQQALIARMGYLSPTVLTHQAYMDIAGTGSAQFANFLEHAHAYQAVWKAHFVPKYFADVAFRANDFDVLPPFLPNDIRNERLFGRLLPPILMCFFCGLILLGLAFVRYRSQTIHMP
ncbi:MAG: DUF3526 domain-containing protein [Rhodothermales bacterium]